MSIEIRHEASASRFVAMVEGEACVLEYQLVGSTMTITHTGVPASLGGRGIAGQLARFALDKAKTEGWKVVPACTYIAAWIEKHPEYQELLA
ncbi:MAG TPA: GNAT family N-acetyltransferase [Dokdonella sp.]|uniref:GNAT family N-acetyltransferase n=1 Tax=Dokdonella sp. TaxID=2291710 RepID=UPI002D7EE709|nr:GNAT family N-acetyltransferase [Dokdonella sp.]HET9031379.1 GNAT family N-acetyltransferase [Dokdonella sp.]